MDKKNYTEGTRGDTEFTENRCSGRESGHVADWVGTKCVHGRASVRTGSRQGAAWVEPRCGPGRDRVRAWSCGALAAAWAHRTRRGRRGSIFVKQVEPGVPAGLFGGAPPKER